MSEQWERGEHPAQAEVHEPLTEFDGPIGVTPEPEGCQFRKLNEREWLCETHDVIVIGPEPVKCPTGHGEGATPKYGWHGWDVGEDVEPPEPGKMWITITYYGEEFAVIVHRWKNMLDPHWNDDRMKAKALRAQFIVDALNAYDG